MAGNKRKGLLMLVTIVVPDNSVTIDGRSLPIDCSAIDGNIRVIQWYDTFGEIEFWNTPGVPFKLNGRLDHINDLDEFQEAIDAWQALAAKLDAVLLLQRTTPQQAVEMITQIEATPGLQEEPIDVAAEKLRKIQIDGDLDINTLGLDECLRLYDIIQAEPALKAIYPGAAVQTLQKIEADPDLSAMPMADAVEKVINPPAVPTPQQTKMIELHVATMAQQSLPPPPPPPPPPSAGKP
jgi:hypothetical protein